VAFPQVLDSEKFPKLYLDVHLGPVETLKALGIETSEAEIYIISQRICSIATQKNENGRYH
jgi:hypothetical protein